MISNENLEAFVEIVKADSDDKGFPRKIDSNFLFMRNWLNRAGST